MNPEIPVQKSLENKPEKKPVDLKNYYTNYLLQKKLDAKDASTYIKYVLLDIKEGLNNGERDLEKSLTKELELKLKSDAGLNIHELIASLEKHKQNIEDSVYKLALKVLLYLANGFWPTF